MQNRTFINYIIKPGNARQPYYKQHMVDKVKWENAIKHFPI